MASAQDGDMQPAPSDGGGMRKRHGGDASADLKSGADAAPASAATTGLRWVGWATMAAVAVAGCVGASFPQIRDRVWPVRFADLAVVPEPGGVAVITRERFQRLRASALPPQPAGHKMSLEGIAKQRWHARAAWMSLNISAEHLSLNSHLHPCSALVSTCGWTLPQG